jgi:hypothetical protein
MDTPIDLGNKLVGTTLRRGNTGIIVCPSAQDRSILFTTESKNAMCILGDGKIQHNTKTTNGQLNIGSTSNHISLHYSTSINQQPLSNSFASIDVDINGSMNLNATSTIELKKSSKVTGSLTTTIPIATPSGGTGINQYQLGDLLVGNITGSLSKLSMNAPSGSVIVRGVGGLAWGFSHMTKAATSYGSLKMTSNTDYTLGPYIATPSTDSNALVSVAQTTYTPSTVGLNRSPNTIFPRR